VFDTLGIAKPSYLDVGAHHPFYLSNTWLFYKGGSRGVNIEPDPDLIKKFSRYRSSDVNLNIGIGLQKDERELYIMSTRTLNTFSLEEARRYETESNERIVDTRRIPIKNINDIIERYFDSSPDFISIDVEGLDLEIIKSFDFSRFRPHVFCIETLTYSSSRAGVKLKEFDELMDHNGYMSYADTHINTIYVNRESWQKT